MYVCGPRGTGKFLTEEVFFAVPIPAVYAVVYDLGVARGVLGHVLG